MKCNNTKECVRVAMSLVFARARSAHEESSVVIDMFKCVRLSDEIPKKEAYEIPKKHKE